VPVPHRTELASHDYSLSSHSASQMLFHFTGRSFAFPTALSFPSSSLTAKFENSKKDEQKPINF
jgi:hypothetical protein